MTRATLKRKCHTILLVLGRGHHDFRWRPLEQSPAFRHCHLLSGGAVGGEVLEDKIPRGIVSHETHGVLHGFAEALTKPERCVGKCRSGTDERSESELPFNR